MKTSLLFVSFWAVTTTAFSPSPVTTFNKKASPWILEAKKKNGKSKGSSVPAKTSKGFGSKPKAEMIRPSPEEAARNLLSYRLSLEAKLRTKKNIGPQPASKVFAKLPSRDPFKEERIARSLLASRLALQASIRSKIVEDVGPKPTPKMAIELPPRDPVKDEMNARSLLASRLTFEKVAAETKRKREQEKRQRGILSHRLAIQSKAWEVERAKLEAAAALRKARQQPKAPQEEQILANKYKAIECIEERAFTILMDLGMVGA
ncbi:hypothetical protein FisN_10Hh246 [Fistulifera solaris]|uniref:Uncharacterized protein n=1 Tax=Fistulifera solaris TaxID=1519565 RepID=A0A1Z5JWY7_FISSO|nr:hypothetical protein FisN_10Hh246 [Fistulifera solaris]|eukprot:GAX18553.1 hypothetical protein FisN_10Hh246 [Fistulifera solaris]